MTAHVMVEERQRCYNAGMVDHITKPIDPQAMFETISHWYKPCIEIQAEIAGALSELNSEVIFPEIPGINVADGLARVAGHSKLYGDLLRRFIATQGGAALSIEEALGSGDTELAHRLAHTLRGVAGNIGAVHVQDLAGELEKIIHSTPSAHTQNLLLQLRQAMGNLVAAIETALLSVQVEIPAVPVLQPTHAELEKVIATLAGYLENSDSESAFYFDSVKDSLGATMDQAQLSALGTSIAGYNFQAATVTLNALAESWHTTNRSADHG
jgi:two-component system sensor histidine kinase/response regulator